MYLVKDLLIVGVAVDRSHQPAFDTNRVVQHLRHWRQAVGGAACVGNDHVGSGQHVVINAKDDRFVDIFARRRNQDTLCTCCQMLLGACAIREEARAFKGNVDAICGMRQVGRVTLCSNMDTVTIDDDVVAICLNCAGERAVYAVTFEQKCVGLSWR